MDQEQEIEFGELEQSEPQNAIRPDRNRHFAVVAVGAPSDDDLPVFVELDALRDMEKHALSDTTVELGGVMLGRQHQDEDGNSFVVINDSLRARHYQATKGSFKFTHDTWERISREREEFPADWQMVGWYHTHPDWSVFLSGMDMFICDHFFNKPLDVALVIDPCRRDRGFFQWTDQISERVRRTTGFYLIASRFRQSELEQFATSLEEIQTMPSTYPHSGGAPIINVGGQTAWHTVAVLSLLVVQSCFLMILAWLLLAPRDEPMANQPANALQERIDELKLADRQRVELAAKFDVLDSVMNQPGVTPDHLVSRLAERQSEVAELRDSLKAHRALSASLETQASEATTALAIAGRREATLQKRIESLQTQVSEFKSKETSAVTAGDEPESSMSRNWLWIALGMVVGALGGGAAVAGFGRPNEKDQNSENFVTTREDDERRDEQR
jgi:proteasome lid subunit RPN8/RPN11